jgi:hypothetical protein
MVKWDGPNYGLQLVFKIFLIGLYFLKVVILFKGTVSQKSWRDEGTG